MAECFAIISFSSIENPNLLNKRSYEPTYDNFLFFYLICFKHMFNMLVSNKCLKCVFEVIYAKTY